MGRAKGYKQYFNFIGGWNTEASPMTFPENAATDLENVILDSDGSIRRRAGIDFENFGSKYGMNYTAAQLAEYAVSFNEWRNVGGSGSLHMLVTQCGTDLYFHIMSGATTSANLAGTVDMSPFVINSAEAKKNQISVASGSGVLFICGRYINPFYVTYNGDTVDASAVNIQIRDLEGDPQGLTKNDLRPKTAGDTHVYDLLNQGWPISRINKFCGNTCVTGSDGAYTTVNQTASYLWPSLADMHILGMRTNPEDAELYFDRGELLNQTFGNTRAPRGHYILNAFKQDRNLASGLSGATNTTFYNRPETVAFHNGRVFWAGLFTQGKTGNVYFSQQLTDISKAGNCYQEQDPTAEDFNDLLDTDGGLIPIPNAGQIYRMIEAGDGIVIFAGNGVWQITGSRGKFSATDFAVTLVTDMGCIAGDTVVSVGEDILYWSDYGIIGLKIDQITGRLSATNVSMETIQTGYLSISGISRRLARGTFIPEEKKVVWIYNSQPVSDGTSDRYRYDAALILDVSLGAFYKYKLALAPSGYPYVAGIGRTVPFSSGVTSDNVTVNGTLVTVGGEAVTLDDVRVTGDNVTTWKLLTVVNEGIDYGFTMSEFRSRSWHDWFTLDGVGVNYTSFLETGYDLFERAAVMKSPTYVFTYMSPLSKSLIPGGYYELPSLIGYSSGFRSTQVVKEILVKIDANIRCTQITKEILIKN